jgi:hypothetical protein
VRSPNIATAFVREEALKSSKGGRSHITVLARIDHEEDLVPSRKEDVDS